MTTTALTSTQKGKVTEQLVASALLIASNGRLAPFVPLADDHGIDLIVMDKRTRGKMAIQIKSAIAGPDQSTVQFDVRMKTHQSEAGEYLIMVTFDPDRMALCKAWLIPMDELSEVAGIRPDKYALTPSLKQDTRDKYRRYRYDDARQLTQAVLDALTAASRAL